MNSTIIYIPFIQKCPICGGDVTYITDSITKVQRARCLNEEEVWRVRVKKEKN